MSEFKDYEEPENEEVSVLDLKMRPLGTLGGLEETPEDTEAEPSEEMEENVVDESQDPKVESFDVEEAMDEMAFDGLQETLSDPRKDPETPDGSEMTGTAKDEIRHTRLEPFEFQGRTDAEERSLDGMETIPYPTIELEADIPECEREEQPKGKYQPEIHGQQLEPEDTKEKFSVAIEREKIPGSSAQLEPVEREATEDSEKYDPTCRWRQDNAVDVAVELLK